ncbi:MAG: hypothetical protein JWO48_857 [Bryobacterales bacterium]|nr:hypothetical protein [Bryobacterales bacterium]
MDQGILVGPEIEAGKKLIEALDASGFRVKAAFWFYREESEEWRLYIATPLSEGARTSRGLLQSSGGAGEKQDRLHRSFQNIGD